MVSVCPRQQLAGGDPDEAVRYTRGLASRRLSDTVTPTPAFHLERKVSQHHGWRGAMKCFGAGEVEDIDRQGLQQWRQLRHHRPDAD
jgi:hypothetical protein